MDKNWQEVLKENGYPTTTVTLDFETFYEKGKGKYNLSELSYVEYVLDDQFAFTGMGVFACHQPFADVRNCIFISPERIEEQIRTLQHNYGDNWERCTYVNQNIMFDALILKEKFGIIPKYTVDTLNLARHEDSRRPNKLEKLCEYYNASVSKGDTSIANGLHWEDMSPGKKKKWADYTRTDIVVTTEIFRLLLPRLSNPSIELQLQQHTLEMFLTPRFEFDFHLAKNLMVGMYDELNLVLDSVHHIMEYATKKHIKEADKDDTLSGKEKQRKLIIDVVRSDKFVVALRNELRRVGEDVPLKDNGKGKMIAALAQTDVGFQQLLKHTDERIRNLALARKGSKSWPTHIKRLESMWRQAELRGGMIAAALLYYGSHTGRWSGTQGNPQNLPGVGRTGGGTHPLLKRMRNCLKVPSK